MGGDGGSNEEDVESVFRGSLIVTGRLSRAIEPERGDLTPGVPIPPAGRMFGCWTRFHGRWKPENPSFALLREEARGDRLNISMVPTDHSEHEVPGVADVGDRQ